MSVMLMSVIDGVYRGYPQGSTALSDLAVCTESADSLPQHDGIRIVSVTEPPMLLGG